MRLRTMAAVGLGYVLGRRAGEKRYEDMQRLYHDVVESDTFAEVVTRVKESLGEGVRMVTGTKPELGDTEGAGQGQQEAESGGDSAGGEEASENEH